MKAKLLVGVVGLSVLAAAGSAYRYFYTRSPQYAFAQIKKSIEEHDKDRFHEFVDLDSLLSHGVDDFMASQQKSDNSFFAAGLAAFMKPRMVEILKEQIDRLVEASAPPLNETGAEPEVNLAGYFRVAQAKAAFKSLKREGKITTVGFEITHGKYNIPITVYVRLREYDGHLRVIEIANLREIKERVDAAEKEWKVAQNRPVRESLDHALHAGSLVAKKRTDEWNIEKRLELLLTIKNIGLRSLKAWSGDLVLLDNTGRSVVALPLKGEMVEALSMNDEDTLKWDFHINQFIDRDVALWSADFSQLHSTLRVTKITYADGQELAVPYPDVESASSP